MSVPHATAQPSSGHAPSAALRPDAPGTGAAAAGLRRVLLADAAGGILPAPLLVLGAGPLSAALGLPQPLLVGAGLLLVPCAALMALAARAVPRSTVLAWLVVIGNLAWVVASLGLLAVVRPTALGTAVVLAQAFAVLLLAGLEWRGLRRLAMAG